VEARVSTPLAPDAALPQRDTLLSPAAFAPRLAELLRRRVDGCELLRAKYRIGESVRTVYRVVAEDRVLRLSAHAFGAGDSEREYLRARASAIATGAVPAVMHAPDLETVVWTFPNDRRLGGLPALVATVGEPNVVAYAPEKSATAACGPAGAAAFAKVYYDDSGVRTLRLHHRLASATEFDVPRGLGYVHERRTLLVGAAEGTRLDEQRGERLLHGLRALGSALARLHATPPPEWLGRFERLDPGKLATAAELVGRGQPHLAARAAALLRALEGTSPAAADCALLHGDVHPKNVFVTAAGRIVLIDLDNVGRGDAHADVGSFLAALRYRRLAGPLSAAHERELGEAFLAGYRRAGGELDPGALAWNTAAALLAERALRAVNRVRPSGLAVLPHVLAEATALVDGRARG
jgi:aminoglycoside phosphotransferase